MIAAGLAVGTAVPASAIQRITCGSRTDFLKFYATSEQGTICFQNAGTTSYRLTFQSYTSGNNAGYFHQDGHSDVYFAKNGGFSYATPITATVEHIN
jgi:hypothetical protein